VEHVEFDLPMLAKIKSGVRVLATMPNFPYTSHVRHLTDIEQVTERYGLAFTSLGVDTSLENAQGKTFFLCKVRRRSYLCAELVARHRSSGDPGQSRQNSPGHRAALFLIENRRRTALHAVVNSFSVADVDRPEPVMTTLMESLIVAGGRPGCRDK
jgi:hypothetical protein